MVLGYVLVHVLGLDVEEERVGVCVKELAPIAIPSLYLGPTGQEGDES